MANETFVDPRFLAYDTQEVQELLGKVEHADSAPTADSENMITSGAVAAALAGVNETTEERLAEKMDVTPTASEEDVRGIVANYRPASDSSEDEPDGSTSDSSNSSGSSSGSAGE